MTLLNTYLVALTNEKQFAPEQAHHVPSLYNINRVHRFLTSLNQYFPAQVTNALSRGRGLAQRLTDLPVQQLLAVLHRTVRRLPIHARLQ